jgi:uncharacterized protein YidB (DUF937 family)
MSDSNISAAIMDLINQHGGVSGLLQKFEQGGLGGVASSWVSSGENQQASPDQIHDALGHDAVQNAAEKNGMSTSELLEQLAQRLPQIIDTMTPNGKVPEAGQSGGGWLSAVMGLLGGRNRG